MSIIKEFRSGQGRHPPDVTKQHMELLKLGNPKVVPYKQLPEEAKNSIAVYLVSGLSLPAKPDGDSWPMPTVEQCKEAVNRAMPNRKFGIVTVPMKAVTDWMMKYRDISLDDLEFETFDQYHKWYLKNNHVPKHKERWPAIMGSFDNELLQDGWHRFNSYYRAGDKTLTMLYFIAEPENIGNAMWSELQDAIVDVLNGN